MNFFWVSATHQTTDGFHYCFAYQVLFFWPFPRRLESGNLPCRSLFFRRHDFENFHLNF
ncbi:unnamed protein product [Schistosoma margrebowiei]|uniref:Uncharacterized protein n=1 Tax=Schistosoma margrebowiei TaxID=48269 RepID=A0A3P8BTA7_9TREM|nr:unnamed protein product [Schistosoma margrebowiei]